MNLAKHLSSVINDPRTPKRLHDVIVDEFSGMGGKTLQELTDSPEFIAKQLCEEGGDVE